MNNRSRYTRYNTRRRPVLLGTAALASVVLLALGGLLLVGLDTVGSQGKQLTRVSQPEKAQAPEVTEEESGEGNAEANSSEDSSGEESGNAAEEKGSEDRGSDEAEREKESGGESDKEQESEPQQVQEEPDPPEPSNPNMWMSIPRLGMQGDTVYNDSSIQTMHQGAIKLPPTGFPWEDNANTYISAHRVGFPGTQSDNQFYNLPAMQQNDAVYLSDSNGTTYEYRVTEKFAVDPSENWVTEPQPGGDMVTLQTCVVSPDPSTWWDITPALFELGPETGRLIVQAEKVETYPAQ